MSRLMGRRLFLWEQLINPKKVKWFSTWLSRIKMFCASFIKRMKSRNLWKRTIKNKLYELQRHEDGVQPYNLPLREEPS